MRTLSSFETLTVWERGMGWHPLDRGLLALRFADGSAGERIADWPLGRRNRALLELHEAWFGSQLEAWAACPQCGEKVEFELNVPDLTAPQPDKKQQTTVAVGEQTFRLPTSRDLAQAAISSDEQEASIQLLELCGIGDVEPAGWTDEIIEKIAESLAAADPMAETRVALTCPACDHEWSDSIDVASFIWAELEARARRLLWEVHSLASAYGWSESETLAMSAARRALYLEMVRA
ncbi:MAG: phage baseplate protein [Bryobacteraceae bacterium]